MNRNLYTQFALLEGGLAAGALIIDAFFTSRIPFYLNTNYLAWALPSALPLFLLMALIYLPVFQTTRKRLVEILEIFAGMSILELASLCVLAGIGEEFFFRGFLQARLAGLTDPWMGLVLSSAIFGLLHWITPVYALFAAAAGFYLGWLFLFSGNLVLPAVAHGLYDFLALLFFLRIKAQISSR